jgi:hypothetical protein
MARAAALKVATIVETFAPSNQTGAWAFTGDSTLISGKLNAGCYAKCISIAQYHAPGM